MRQVALRLAMAAALALLPVAVSGQDAPPPRTIAVGQNIAGELTSNAAQRRSGKFEDVYLIQGHRGERVQIDLASTAFDAYLVVTGPEGFSLSNDDQAGGDTLNSRVVMQLPADGIYRVSATTYRPGATGAY